MTSGGLHDRRLLHGALAVSAIFLMIAEREFLDWPVLAAILAISLVAIAYEESTEGRRPLPEAAGNIAGALVGIVGGGWALSQALANRYMPLSVALIPFVAALIPVLTVVKLLKRQIPRDFWVLQGLGLVQVGLGCVLGADDPMVALVGLYAVLSLNSLRSRLTGGIWPGLGAIVAEGLVVGLAAFAAYIWLPMADLPAWNPTSTFSAARLATGYGTEVDLNHDGRVTLDDEVAIEFDALDQTGKPTMIPSDQRFRAVDLEIYRAGRWRGSATSTGGRGVPMALPPLPTLTTRQNLLNFRVISQDITTPVIADPALFLPVPGPGINRRGIVRRQLAYQQIVAAGTAKDKSPLQDDVDNRFRLEDLLGFPEGLRPWAWELLDSIADGGARASRSATGPLPLSALREAPNRPEFLPIGLFEEVARRLCRYFADSGDYEYTLELERSDPAVDPVVDFLRNTRRGHCERFASGLALTLRSVGVPARLVKGFRGCESTEEGKYQIRNYHAHSWVEALVPRYDRGPQQRVSWDWLVLDPTPGESSTQSETKGPEGWLGAVGGWINQQQPLVDEFRSWWSEAGASGVPNWAGPALAMGIGGMALLWMRRGRARAARAGRDIVPRLRAMASLEGIRMSAAQTPREIALEIWERWREDPLLGPRGADALWLADEHYRWVFSGAQPDQDDAKVVFAKLGELEGLVRESFRRRRGRIR